MIYLIKDNEFDKLVFRCIFRSSESEIIKLLRNDDYRIRTFAAQTIQLKYANKKNFDMVVEMLKSKNYRDREIGAYILGQFGTPEMPFAMKSLNELNKLLDDKSIQVLTSVICSIGHIWLLSKDIEFYDEKIVSKIKKYVYHNSINIRICSVMTLSSLKNRNDIIEFVKELYQIEKNEKVREWIEVALDILLDK